MKKFLTMIFSVLILLATPVLADDFGSPESHGTKKLNKYGYRKYRPYSGELNYTVTDSKSIGYKGIEIVANRLKLKSKINRNANGIEYVIKNNTDKNILIESVDGENLMSMFKASVYSLIPHPKDFIPGYRFYYTFQSFTERNRFTRRLPAEEIIEAHSEMRILALCRKKNEPATVFRFIIEDGRVVISFESEPLDDSPEPDDEEDIEADEIPAKDSSDL